MLVKKIIIKGKIIAQTGLMIGGNNAAMDIGGTDKQVIRNPITKIPYIPGSSLKGKMRSQLEISHGTVSEKGGPTQNPAHAAAQLFGHINQNEQKKQQPSRLIVRDGAMLNAKSNQFKETELLYTEVKAENTIDRITAAANPRFFERVPAGAEFAMEMTLNIFEDDANKDHLLSYVYESLQLVQDDYLGGGGSRGNGQIRFEIEKVVARTSDFYKVPPKGTEEDLTSQVPVTLKA
ncbi:MAG: type III-A CRISPR-associated RAMP protein Csm3 [Bacteroidota bacterium]